MKKFLIMMIFLLSSCTTLYFDQDSILVQDNKVICSNNDNNTKVKCYDMNNFIDDYMKTSSYKENSLYNKCDNYGGYHIQFRNNRIYSISTLSQIPNNHISGYVIGIICFLLFYIIWWFAAEPIYNYKKERKIEELMYDNSAYKTEIDNLNDQLNIASNVIKNQEKELDMLRIYKKDKNDE